MENKCYDIISSKNPIEILNSKPNIDYKKLLENSTYHNKTNIMEWIFSHKELIPNIDIEKIFDEIGKYGAGKSQKQYQILLDNGYNNYLKLLYKIYDKYPELVDKIVEYIPNKDVEKITNFPKNKEEMAKYINDMHYGHNNILNCFPLSTLKSIVFYYSDEENDETYIKEEDYDSKEEYLLEIENIRKYHESKNEIRYQCREYLQLLISNIINNEWEYGNYRPIEYPIWHLSNGLIMKNNWDILDSPGKEVIASIYNVEPTFTEVFQAQAKIIRELNEDDELSPELNTRGESMLTDLY